MTQDKPTDPAERKGQGPTDDNLLVFYLPDAEEWKRAVERLEKLGNRPVKACKTFETRTDTESCCSTRAGPNDVAVERACEE
jgi:hypothetical protein